MEFAAGRGLRATGAAGRRVAAAHCRLGRSGGTSLGGQCSPQTALDVAVRQTRVTAAGRGRVPGGQWAGVEEAFTGEPQVDLQRVRLSETLPAPGADIAVLVEDVGGREEGNAQHQVQLEGGPEAEFLSGLDGAGGAEQNSNSPLPRRHWLGVH